MKVLKIEKTNKKFSSFGGLHLMTSVLRKTQLKSILYPILPVSPKLNLSSWPKFELMVLGFQAGAQCLDDWDGLAFDPVFDELSRSYTSKSLGDFLRQFSGHQISKLRHRLIDLSFKLREVGGDSKDFVLDIDSSNNIQYGEKMEGVSYHYNCKTKGLDTLYAFDNLGFQYWHEVRGGSTFTSENVGQLIHDVISRIPKTPFYKKKRKLIRADSGYCNTEFMDAASAKGCGFVCVGRHTSKILGAAHRIKNWQRTKIRSHDDRECEIGSASLSGFGKYTKHLRIVCLRAKKIGIDKPLFEVDGYDYYIFVTNMGQHEMSHEDLIYFYRKRGHAENFIREQKNGFDLKHYPCKKLPANNVFGLISAFAYTLMRLMALAKPKQKKTKNGIQKIVQFAKAHRKRWLLLPTQVVCHAKGVVFKYSQRHYEEVRSWQTYIHKLQFV